MLSINESLTKLTRYAYNVILATVVKKLYETDIYDDDKNIY